MSEPAIPEAARNILSIANGYAELYKADMKHHIDYLEDKEIKNYVTDKEDHAGISYVCGFYCNMEVDIILVHNDVSIDDVEELLRGTYDSIICGKFITNNSDGTHCITYGHIYSKCRNLYIAFDRI